MTLPVALLENLGLGELVVVAALALLLFGKEMPVVSRKLGKMLAEFKRGMSEASSELSREMDDAAREVEREKSSALPSHYNADTPSAVPTPSIPASTLADSPSSPPLADAFALDSNRAGNLHVPQNAVPVAKPAALDKKDIPPPSRIPPSVA